MPKVGRNQPCPCGSGKKYKQCCLAADEAARPAAPPPPPPQPSLAALKAKDAQSYNEQKRLERLSNDSLDLIHAGRLDEAEPMCQQLLTKFPDEFDGHMRFGALHRARGDHKRAAEHLRLAATMARVSDFDLELAAALDAEANELDPPAR